MKIVDKINYLYDEVSKSKFGPIFFEYVDGKISKLDNVHQQGSELKNNIVMNDRAFEVFRTCLTLTLGFKFKEETTGEQWKGFEAEPE